jgi:homoserine acetyltransferase
MTTEPVSRADLPWALVPRVARVQGLIAVAAGDIALARKRFREADASWRRVLATVTQANAEAYLATLVQRQQAMLDANDMLYQFDASRFYNPLPHLGEIRAPLYAVNSADDEINPPELGILDAAIRKVPRGRYILLPLSPETRGHGTHSLPAIWGKYLAELLAASEH